ncbi:MAG: cardiolipin synthase [bacterium]|nr:cardiolipin synthase [bacterium]
MKIVKILFRIIFHPLTLVVISLLFQIFLVGFFLYFFRQYFLFLFFLSYLLSLLFSLYILNQNQNPSYKISWLCLLFFLPIFGVIFYFLTHIPFIKKKISSEIAKGHHDILRYLDSSLDFTATSDHTFFHYMSKFGYFPCYQKTKAEYFSDGITFFNDLMLEIRQAKKYIFLEFFIIEDGVMWNTLLTVLKQKVKEGIEIRILYDGIGSIACYADQFSKKMTEYGILCKVFFPIKPIFSLYQNHRDHRKICIIDGKIAYTGGINIGDDYINRKQRFGYWKDCGIKLIGPAVDRFTLLFFEMWNLGVADHSSYEDYLFGDIVRQADCTGTIVPFGDSPYHPEEIAKNVYLHILNSATQFVHIITPYLVLDHELLNTLIFTAKRGVKIQIIMPHIPDKKMVNCLGKSYYKELMENSIEIYEYLPGFCHAKVFSSDFERAVVGTINLDYRSLYLHFECGVYLYRDSVIQNVEHDFQSTLKECRKIRVSDIKYYPFYKKILGRVLRLFSPLL